jgi:hypothetical protein
MALHLLSLIYMVREALHLYVHSDCFELGYSLWVTLERMTVHVSLAVSREGFKKLQNWKVK